VKHLRRYRDRCCIDHENARPIEDKAKDLIQMRRRNSG
jgi:hypothetical protein